MSHVSRREFIRRTGAAGLLLAGWPRGPARALAGGEPPARALILLWLEGGPSHLDTFDPKPGTPFAGSSGAIRTRIPGVQFASYYPRLAAQAHRLAVIHSLTSREGDHERATAWAHTGKTPMPADPWPGLGSMLSHGAPAAAKPAGPRAFSVLAEGASPGFLGVEHACLPIRDSLEPTAGWFPEGEDRPALRRRFAYLKELEALEPAGEAAPAALAHRRSLQDAEHFLGSPLYGALDLKSEKAALRERYGKTPLGAGCLIARRLVEAGATFAEVTLEGWDSHFDNFTVHQRLGKVLDDALATLVEDLASRGLLESTMVLCMGEFGRTPEINARSGRDHHPGVFSAVMAGGPVPGGLVVGRSDEQGRSVAERPVTVPDLLATVYSAMGLRPDQEMMTPQGRPVKRLDSGVPVPELLGA